MNSVVPKNWYPLNLSDVVKFSGGSAFKEIYQGEHSGKYPFIKVSDMNLTGNHRHIVRSNNWISEEVQKLAKAKLFPAQTTVFAKVGAALSLNRRRMLTRKTAIDNNMMAAIPTSCDPDFFYQFMLSVDLRNIVQSGAVPSVNQSQMDVIPFNCPPLPEQRKIAAILTSVDDVIENTQAQIAKLQDLKKATMNELLTKGIGHTEFKDSELGQIPRSWVVKPIGELAKKVGSGVTPKGGASVYQNSGIIFIRSQNVHFGGLRLDDVAYISEQLHGGMNGSNVLVGDVLLNITGASIGRCALVPDDFGAANVNQHVCIIRTREQLKNTFLADWLSSDFGQNQIMRFQAGGNREGLNFQQIRSMSLPLPSLVEQKEICKIIGSLQVALNEANNKVRQTQYLKKALMNDLLTGKVRVNVN